MKTIILLIHLLACFALIFIVLVQRGKGADLGAAFGGGSQAVFGTAGATSILHKITAIVAAIFMFTSLGLTLMMGRGVKSSVMKGMSNVPITGTAQQSTKSVPQQK